MLGASCISTLLCVLQLISAESYLPDNFSLVGPGGAGEGEVLVRENMNTYHVHASGRRYCESMLLSFYLRKRQDLLAWGISVVTRVPDLLDIQVTMNPSAMPPLVLLIARTDLSKAMAKDTADVKAFAKVVDVKKERLASWPTTDVVVHAEQVSTFYELMTPLLLEHTFGKGVWAEIGYCFRFLHITSEGQGTGAKQFINLSLTLPSERDAAHVLEWIRSVIILIDSLGTFKYTPEQTKRATENRSKKEILALNAAEEKRREELAARREKKAEEEQEKLRRMTPKQREKELERRQRIIQRRGLKTMMRKA